MDLKIKGPLLYSPKCDTFQWKTKQQAAQKVIKRRPPSLIEYNFVQNHIAQPSWDYWWQVWRDLICITVILSPPSHLQERRSCFIAITVIESISIAKTITLAICVGALYTLHFILCFSCSFSNQSSNTNTSCNTITVRVSIYTVSCFAPPYSILASSSPAPSQAFEGVWASRLKRGVIWWSLL